MKPGLLATTIIGLAALLPLAIHAAEIRVLASGENPRRGRSMRASTASSAEPAAGAGRSS